jgi:hypothetical protein
VRSGLTVYTVTRKLSNNCTILCTIVSLEEEGYQVTSAFDGYKD